MSSARFDSAKITSLNNSSDPSVPSTGTTGPPGMTQPRFSSPAAPLSRARSTGTVRQVNRYCTSTVTFVIPTSFR